jgi:hypothetical protein
LGLLLQSAATKAAPWAAEERVRRLANIVRRAGTYHFRGVVPGALRTRLNRRELVRAEPGSLIIRDERFWLPLIAVFSGMRQEEICQLHVEDVRQADGIWSST